jgi:hypothetical protein
MKARIKILSDDLQKNVTSVKGDQRSWWKNRATMYLAQPILVKNLNIDLPWKVESQAFGLGTSVIFKKYCPTAHWRKFAQSGA